jgi:hypothetical protein
MPRVTEILSDCPGRNDALRGYVECAVWSSTDPDTCEPLDDVFSPDDISDESLESMSVELEAFIAANFMDCAAYCKQRGADHLGHDFWLTRNHHGAGFWDRGLGDPGERLTAAAHQFGESYLMPTGDTLEVC